MTSYEPPTSNLAIFDSTVFQTDNQPLTIAEANKRYLKFPTAQGDETLLNVNVLGNLTINGVPNLNQPAVERILLPTKPAESNNGNDNNLLISNNNNLAGCGVNANQNIVIGRNTLAAYSGTATNAFTKSTIIGHSALGSSSCNFANEGITAIGSQSLNSISNTVSANDSAYNTAIGYRGLKSLISGASNTGIGYKSGEGDGGGTSEEIVFGDNNTFVGARTGLDFYLSHTVNHSTAIGADAVITGSNQIVLGTLSDTVVVGNSLTFQNTSTVQNSASDNYTTYDYSTTLSLVDEVLVNTLVSLNPSASGLFVNIPDTANVDFNALSRFSVANISNFQTTLRLINSAGNPSSTSTFTGLYGSQANTILLQPKSQLNVFINSTGLATFVVQDRIPEVIGFTTAYSGTAITLTSSQYFDSIITLTGTVATTISIPDPRSSVNLFSANRRITLINDGSGLLTINSTNGNFGGNNGNSASTILLPDNAYYTFNCNGTTWEINERSPNITYQNLNVNLASVVDYSNNYNYLGATLNISSTVSGTIFYPLPSNSQAHLTTSIIRNVGNFYIYVQLSEFNTWGGNYGRGAISNIYLIQPNSWIKLFSDGTLYRVDERSEPNNSIGMDNNSLDISSQKYYTDCRLSISPFSDSSILTISNPTLVGGHYYNIFNEGSSHILSISSSGSGFNFASSAKYSFDSPVTNNLPIAPNSWVKLYSDGSNWRVYDKSSDNQIYNYTSSTSFAQTGLLTNNSTTNITTSAANVIYTLVNPSSDFCEGAYQKIYNKSGINILTLNATGASNFVGRFGSGTTSIIVPPNCWVLLVSNGTQWSVDDRSSNTNYFLLANGTSFNWTQAFQYLDTTVEFVSPDAPSTLITRTTFSGASCTQTSGSYNITISSTIASGTIGVGAVIIIIGHPRRYITAQVSGTAGGGSGAVYSTSVKANSNISGISFSGFAGTGTTTKGTITTFLVNQTTNYSVATLSSSTLVAGSSFSFNTANMLTPNYIYSNEGAGVYKMTSGTRGGGAGDFFTTSGTTINIPTASNVPFRSVTFVNSGYTAVNITTVTGTSLFTGTYGQFDGSLPSFPNKYLLKPSETVVLKSDGTNWETQVGTSLGGARIWASDVTTTSTADLGLGITSINTTEIADYYPAETLTQSNLSGVISSGSTFINTYPFPITINFAANVLWNPPTAVDPNTSTVAYSTKPPQRYLEIRQVSTKAGGNYPSNTGLTLLINFPCTAVPQTIPAPAYSKIRFNSDSNYCWQSLNGLFTLQTGDTLTMKIAKVTGNVLDESIAGLTVYINRVA